MEKLNLQEETIRHLQDGARSVHAYSPHKSYVISWNPKENLFLIVIEEEGFRKIKTTSLTEFFSDVFGISVNR